MTRKEVLPPFTGQELLEKRLAELKIALRTLKERQNPQLQGKLYVSKSHGTYQFRLVSEEGEKIAVAGNQVDGAEDRIATTTNVATPEDRIATTTNVATPEDKIATTTNVATPEDRISAPTKYFSKTQTELIHQYCQKEYEEKLIVLLQKQIHKIEKLLPVVCKNPSTEAVQILPAAKQMFVTPANLPPAEYAAIWQNVYYKKKGFYPNAAQFLTANGDRVRSKSETIIADTLHHLKIPFRYEFPVKMNAHGKVITFHPDFYCLNLRTRQEFIWEHFGLFDDTNYAENVTQKIQIYHENGYNEGKNLLYTFETETSPLTSKHVEKIAREYLL